MRTVASGWNCNLGSRITVEAREITSIEHPSLVWGRIDSANRDSA
jgi:hypothetical protein